MAKSKFTFDYFVVYVCNFLHMKGLGNYYMEHSWFKRFVKFGTTTFLIYWMIKGPLIWVFTDHLGLWYVVSAFLAGLILTIAGFILNEIWIWKTKK